jgi:beta-lactamase regulating signal transducer with metallopeptidase domain
MATVLVEAALRSLALGVAVGLGLWITRARSARLQMAAWTLVLAGAILMPALMRWHTVEIQTPERVAAKAPAVFRAASASVPVVMAPAAPADASLPWRTIASTGYLAVTGILLLRLITGLLLTFNLWRRSKSVGEPWAGALDVRETSRIGAPATFGTSILLPASWRTWDDPKLQAVLAHERSHVEWRDFYVLLVARVYLAVFWFNPLAWWLRSRLITLAEAACDDAALGAIADRPFYAQILVGFAGGPQPSSEAVAMARVSTVTRRVERILSGATIPAKIGWKQYSLVAACACGLATVIAGCSVSAQTPAETAPPEAKSSEPARAAKKPVKSTFWWQGGTHGDSYAIVSGDSLTMSGSSADAERARSFRSRINGAYIWFSTGGKDYLITDPAAVKHAQELFAPQEELGRKQGELGTLQATLGEQQAHLGMQQAAASVKMPSFDEDLKAVRDELEAAQKELSEKTRSELANTSKVLAELDSELKAAKDKEFTQAQIGELQAKAASAQAHLSQDVASRQGEMQSRMAELQAKFGEMQSRAGEIQARLGQEQAHLGEQQAKLGDQQAKLGEKQAKLAEEAERQMRRLFEESLKNGLAQPAK